MINNKNKLIELAKEIFSNEVAEEVIKTIEREENKTTVNKSILFLNFDKRFYNKLEIGEFKGNISLTWVDKDIFLFDDNSSNSFQYITSKNQIIKPKQMLTDGGSIPKFLQIFKKFSPWNYTPAYLIHDWLFIAHKYGDKNEITFKESAWIMAECIKTLMEKGFINSQNKLIEYEKNEAILYILYLGVSSFIAKNIWEKELDD